MFRRLVTAKPWSAFLVVAILMSLTAGVALAQPGIDPDTVERLIFPGESEDVAKAVTTPEIPPLVDICLLEDETGSFEDDIDNLKIAASDLYDTVLLTSPGAQFAVAGFRDYPVGPYGDPGDWVYRLLSTMNADKTAWINGVNALSAGGGNDEPEAQYDAIVAAAGPGTFDDPTLGLQNDCGWRADPLVARVLVVATDAPFHTPDGTHVNDEASTIAALEAQDITVIGLKAPGAGAELDALAAATDGSVQPLSSDGANIAEAIVAGLENLPAEVAMLSTCVAPVSTSFVPDAQTVTSGDVANFTETIAVAAGAAGGTYTCYDYATINGEDLVDEAGALITEDKTIHVPGIDLQPETDTNELGFDLSHAVVATVSAGDYGPVPGVRVEFEVIAGPNAGPTGTDVTDAAGEANFSYTPAVEPASLGTDTIQACFTNADGTVVYGCDTAEKTWQDTTPPTAACVPTVNPSGKHVPNAPGNGGQGQNQDGFYMISGEDVVWPADALEIYVRDSGSGTEWGPFPAGTDIKYTEAPGSEPSIDYMGGNNGNGNGGQAVELRIKGTGDAEVIAVDGSGNVSDPVDCLVPPPPK